MWSEDPTVMSAFDDMMRGMHPLVDNFMKAMQPYFDNSPNSLLLRLSAKGVVHYNKARAKMNCTENEAFHYMISQMTGDPEAQLMFQQFSNMMMNRGAGLE
jgi:hypothetical protein